MKTCLQCGAPLSDQKRFCSVSCRKAFGWHRLNENGRSGGCYDTLPFAEWPKERQERWLKAWKSDLGRERLHFLLRKPVPTELIVALRSSGLTYKAIGDRVGITADSASQRMRRYSEVAI
jgi:hypothetical protein